MTIEEIYNSEDISVRSFNVCKDNSLIDLSSILKYFSENKTFDNLRNCGRKSNDELTALCFKYINYDGNQIVESSKIKKHVISAITNFTRAQREIVNSFVEINSNNLSNRGKNAISSFLKGNLKIRNISERILIDDRFNLQDIKNVGAKTLTELKCFIDSIIEFILKVDEVTNEKDLVSLRNRVFIDKEFAISYIPDEILESQSVFSLVDFLINKDAIFKKNENIIFRKAFKIYDKQPELTLDKLAEEINNSRENVRQIRKSIVGDLVNRFQFTRSIEDDLYQNYGIDRNQHLINIEDNLNNLINELSKTHFSNEFNTFIIYTYIADKFDLIGEIEDVLLPKHFNSRERHNWVNFYLVRNHLTNQFDFNNFADDLDKRINTRIEETYSFHFKSYLNNFVKTDDSSIVSIIFPVAERIINQEFNLIIDSNDNIVFKRNTVKQVHEYIIEALEKLGSPSKIEDIYNLIDRDYPGITKSQNALRGSLQRTPGIIYFGRSSTYGLKRWENEKEGVKGGTIKDIILDFLKEKKQPIHISIILEYLKKFRGDKDKRSVITNLKSDPDERFLIYNQRFIGLKENLDIYSKKYDKLPIQLGKTIIAKHQKGFTNSELNMFLLTRYDLSFEESNLIINDLIY
jgi:hypothetical protein